jgi:cell division septum initiation protein DivIVA
MEELQEENRKLKEEIESLQENLDDKELEINILKTALGNIEYEVQNAFHRLENLHVF